MKRVNMSLIIAIVTGLMFFRVGYPADSAFAQFDKIKKAAGGDKKKDKDKKEKKDNATDKSTSGKTTGGGNSLAGYDLTGYLGEPIKSDDQKLFISHLKWGWDGSYSDNEMYHIGVYKLIQNVQSDGLSDVGAARTFYDNYKKMNLEHTKKMIEAARKKWKQFDDDFMENDFKEYSAYYLNDFSAAFQKCADGALTREINKFIDNGAKFLKEGKANEAMDNAEAAGLLCQAVYQVIPDYAPIKTLQADALNIVNKINGEKDKIFTGPIHKKFINKIVFSKTPIIAKQENEAEFTDNFTANDHIYAIVYLNGTFSEILNKTDIPSIGISVLADGNKVQGSDKWYSDCKLLRLPKDISQKAYLEFEILPEVSLSKYPEAAKFIANAFANELSERKHTITIGMIEDKISGEFKIDLTGGGAILKALIPKYEDAKVSNMRLPAPVVNDKPLEAQILALCKKATDFTQAGDVPLRAVIEQYWSDEKDDWGNVKWQYAWAKVAYKAQDGKCYVIRVAVVQDYKGSGKYGATRFYARYNSSGDYEIKFENVNK